MPGDDGGVKWTLTAPSPTLALTDVGAPGVGADDSTVEPGVMPTSARACSDRLEPLPSMLPTSVLLSAVMPTLSKAFDRSSDVLPTVIAKMWIAGVEAVGSLTFGNSILATCLPASRSMPA